MTWFLLYFLISYMMEEICLGSYMKGIEDMPDDFMVAIQLEIWGWPGLLVFGLCCAVYFFFSFMGFLLKEESIHIFNKIFKKESET